MDHDSRLEHELNEMDWEEQALLFTEFVNEYFQFSGVYDKSDRDTILYKFLVKNRHGHKNNFSQTSLSMASTSFSRSS